MTETLQAEQTNHTQRIYNRNASFYDLHEWVVEKLFYQRWRGLLWQQVVDKLVLEVGVGTGKNLAYHPQLVDTVAIDFSAAMLHRAIARNTRQIPLLMADAQRLPFDSSHFDEVVATFVFCSVPDPALGLQEVRRVLRPGGSVLLLEHQRAQWSWLGKVMDWLNPLLCKLTGVNINRTTVQNVEDAGFEIIDVRQLDPTGTFVLIRAVKS